MGSGISAARSKSKAPLAAQEENASVPKWRLVLSSDEARKKYELDGTLEPKCSSSLLELRGYLEDPLLTKHLGLFGKSRQKFESFMCWIDIQEFKLIAMGANDYRRSKALQIYHKYLKVGAQLSLPSFICAVAQPLEETILTAKKNKVDLPLNFFDTIQLQCLQCIHDDIFIPFKKSPAYASIVRDMKEHYNHVTSEDFDYIAMIGSGGFGIVVHCRKKSTGKHYALKIQSKLGLLKCYKGCLHRIDYEKQALAACNHPYIVALDYAFQSDALVFLAMQLGTGKPGAVAVYILHMC